MFRASDDIDGGRETIACLGKEVPGARIIAARWRVWDGAFDMGFCGTDI